MRQAMSRVRRVFPGKKRFPAACALRMPPLLPKPVLRNVPEADRRTETAPATRPLRDGQGIFDHTEKSAGDFMRKTLEKAIAPPESILNWPPRREMRKAP